MFRSSRQLSSQLRMLLPCALASAAILYASVGVMAATQPNVILILTDDQGYGDMSCHGNPDLKTPEIDRLYGDSVRLTDFHVDPTCSPSRAALMTGRYSSRVGVWLTYGSRHHLGRNEVCLADVFRNSGYRTAIFGKWHLGDNYPYRPQDRGFDESLIHGGGMIGETPDYWGNDYYDDVYLRNGEPQRARGYCTDVWFEESMKFIDRNRDQPFFIYLATNAPHGPLHVPEKYTRAFRSNPNVPAERAYFYGMIANIDENLGRLRSHLASLKIERNTLIVFMNDNGTGHGVSLTSRGKPSRDGWIEEGTKQRGFNAGMRGRKGSAYEGGHRAACFMHWPAGGLAGGRDLGGLTAHLDVMPTLIDLCDLKPSRLIAFDGTSLAKPLLASAQYVEPRTLLVHHQGRFGKSIGEGMPIFEKDYCVMSNPWRLVGKQLFNLGNDPGQRIDVAGEHPEVASRLREEYERWWDDISERWDEPNPFVVDPQKQRTVMLSSQNYLGSDVAYHQHHVRSAMPIRDCWTWIDVRVPGEYRITVRRWPREVERAMSDVAETYDIDPTRHYVKDFLLNLPTRPIAVSKVNLRVGEFDETLQVEPNAKQAEFVVPMRLGLQRISSSLIKENGNASSAYYIYIDPLGK